MSLKYVIGHLIDFKWIIVYTQWPSVEDGKIGYASTPHKWEGLESKVPKTRLDNNITSDQYYINNL